MRLKRLPLQNACREKNIDIKEENIPLNHNKSFWKTFWYVFIFGGILVGIFESFCIDILYQYIYANKENLNIYGRFLGVFGITTITFICSVYAIYTFLQLYQYIKNVRYCKIFLIILYCTSIFTYSLVNIPSPIIYIGSLIYTLSSNNKLI